MARRRRSTILEQLDLDNFHLYHAARADLLERLGRLDDAAVAYDRSIALATNAVEQDHLRRRRAELQRSLNQREPARRASVGGAGLVAALGDDPAEHDAARWCRATPQATGWSIGQTCLVTGETGLPNSVRTAAINTLTGLTEATHCRTFGIDSIGTKALEMNVTGKMITKPMPITASGDRTRIPSHSPSQMIADGEHQQQRERLEHVRGTEHVCASRRSARCPAG